MTEEGNLREFFSGNDYLDWMDSYDLQVVSWQIRESVR